MPQALLPLIAATLAIAGALPYQPAKAPVASPLINRHHKLIGREISGYAPAEIEAIEAIAPEVLPRMDIVPAADQAEAVPIVSSSYDSTPVPVEEASVPSLEEDAERIGQTIENQDFTVEEAQPQAHQHSVDTDNELPESYTASAVSATTYAGPSSVLRGTISPSSPVGGDALSVMPVEQQFVPIPKADPNAPGPIIQTGRFTVVSSRILKGADIPQLRQPFVAQQQVVGGYAMPGGQNFGQAPQLYQYNGPLNGRRVFIYKKILRPVRIHHHVTVVRMPGQGQVAEQWAEGGYSNSAAGSSYSEGPLPEGQRIPLRAPLYAPASNGYYTQTQGFMSRS